MTAFNPDIKNNPNIIMSSKNDYLLLFTRTELYRLLKQLALEFGGKDDEAEVMKLWRAKWADKELLLNQINRYMRFEKEKKKPKQPKITSFFTPVNKLNQKKEFDKLLAQGNYNKIVKNALTSVYTLTAQQTNIMWNVIKGKGKFTMTLLNNDGRERIVMLNEATKDWFIDLMRNGGDYVSVVGYGSDIMADYRFVDTKSITIEKLRKPEKALWDKDGKFFPYINKTIIDLTKYQIYKQREAYDKKLIANREHCLINALLLSGVEMEIVNSVKMLYVVGCSIRKKDLKDIASLINRNIVLHSYKKSNDTQKQRFMANIVDGEDVEIAIYKNHYFIYDTTEYTMYSIKNYNDLWNKFDFKDIYRIKGGKYVYDNEKAKITSLTLVKKLFDARHFEKLDLVLFEEAGSNAELKKHIYLGNIGNEQREIKEELKKEQKDKKIFYADCESYVNGDFHSLQLIGVVNDETDCVDIMNVCDDIYKNVKYSKEQKVVLSFMDVLTGNGNHNALCYFHNLKYDYHLLEQYLNITSKCEKDNQTYSVKIKHKGKSIELRDSYKIIPFALSKFQKEFELDKEFSKKEAISYDYYTEENNDKIIKTEEYRKRLSYEEQKIFDIEIKNEYTYDEETETFNPMSYYKEYLRLDCLVLKKGIQKFNELIMKITKDKMSIYDYLTISSLTDQYMKIEGAYEGIYEITGNLREYVAQAVYGGRVCVNKKYVKQVIEEEISDYDGCSLYPSAINRLCREHGLATGEAKRLINFEEWDEMSYAIMTVKITKVNKIQQMPFIAHKGENSISYLNEAPSKPIIIDTYTLQDYIKFHQIEYEIIDGVYWNSGYNKKMGEIIKELYETRLKYKKTNTALANTLKLMLNSSYGKTIMKKSKSKKKIVSSYKFENYVYNNFNTIKNYRKLNDKNFEIEEICADYTYNRGHIGCAILSMSKRIMNEVFDIANDNNYPIYYTDTDSLHCKRADVIKIENRYREIYNKELNGKALEQFHTDFSLDGAVGDIYATKSIFLGKKSYIDYLESKDKDGNIIHGIHKRLKGITEAGLENASKKYKNSYFELYEDLATGKQIEMILNPFNPDENKNKVMFEFKEGKVRTRKEFTRKVKF
jgi:hypothetical protein